MSQRTALVVDDNPDIRTMMKDVLGLLGYSVRAVSNGVEALNAVHEGFPDVVFLDLMMPVMDGFTTLAHLQRTRELRRIPVVIMSALLDSDPTLRNFPGVAGLMPKASFSIPALKTLLEEIASKQQLAA